MSIASSFAYSQAYMDAQTYYCASYDSMVKNIYTARYLGIEKDNMEFYFRDDLTGMTLVGLIYSKFIPEEDIGDSELLESKVNKAVKDFSPTCYDYRVIKYNHRQEF